MDNEDMILNEMENTRTSLTEKLESLESKVAHTVEAATNNVAETVEAVKDSVQETVANMKETVQDTISAVKHGVQEGVDNVREAFDVSGHVQRHPWEMLGGSVAVGFLLGKLFAPKQEPKQEPTFTQRPKSAQRGHSGRHNGNGKNPAAADTVPSMASGLMDKLAPEIDKLKGLAVGALMGAIRDMVVPSLPKTFGESVSGIFDNVTQTLGGKPFKEEGTGQSPPAHDVGEQPEGQKPRWAQVN